VGTWRVVAWQAQGAYGAVYRAVRVGQEHSGPVALKLSLHPWDARFAREAQLLSRLCHPSIPRLLDTGVLRLPPNSEHPFFVMEWVEGTPLYAWAQQHSPSHQQVCWLLAQLARALEALHAAGAVHRDVKGDNVLVRHADGLPVLIDFGSGHFQGAARLTWQALPPGTPAYQSPQAALFHIRSVRERDSYYAPSPADDLFALGVTAYRLLMGEYPPAMDVQEEEDGSWRVTSPDPRPLLQNNPRVEPWLRELILRLLSEAPEARGTAAQVAQVLEASVSQSPARPRALSRVQAWKPWLAWAAMAMVALMPWSQPRPVAVSPEDAPESTTADDSDPTEPRRSTPPPSESRSISQDSPAPEQPLRQARPDAKGRCPMRMQVAFNGLCWVEQASMPAEECVGSGYLRLEGKCYAPALDVPRKAVPTSSPGNAR
jgi:serine/threonine protein kinase